MKNGNGRGHGQNSQIAGEVVGNGWVSRVEEAWSSVVCRLVKWRGAEGLSMTGRSDVVWLVTWPERARRGTARQGGKA